MLVLSSTAAAGPSGACTGWIAVESAPAERGGILLDGKEMGKFTPSTLKGVPCGVHQVEVRKEYHIGGKQQVKVVDGEVVKASIRLQPNFAPLEVDSRPKGATVELDGKKVGVTPLALEQVEAGKHGLRVVLADHHPVERRVVVRPGKPVELSLKLKPAFGSLKIVTRPDMEAEVLLDGDSLGTSPLTLKRVVSGPHQLVVRKDLYADFEKKIVIRDGRKIQVRAVMRPNFGTLQVTSAPTAARVTVDGKPSGKTPTSIKLSAGEHLVTATRPGSESARAEKKVTVRVRGKHKVHLKLPVRTGALMIDTVPFASRVELDGKPMGKAPLSLRDVPVGLHVIVAEAEGKPPLAGQIEVFEDQTALAEMNLNDPNKSVYRSSPGKAAKTEARPEPKSKPAPKTTPSAHAPGAVHTTASKSKTASKTASKTRQPPVDKKKEVAAKEPEKKKEQDRPRTPPRKMAKAGPDPGTSSMPPPTVSDRPMSAMRWGAWLSAGGAVVATGIAITLFVLGADRQSEADDAYAKYRNESDPARRDYYKDRFESLDDEAAGLKTGGWICAGVAVAAAGASVALFLLEPDDPAGTGVAVQATPLPGGGWVGLEARF